MLWHRMLLTRQILDPDIASFDAVAMAEEADFIVTSLPSAEAFHEVTTGQTGIAAAGRTGITVIDTCTLAIDDKAEAARRLADAPLECSG